MQKIYVYVLLASLCLSAKLLQAQSTGCAFDSILLEQQTLNSNFYQRQLIKHNARIEAFRERPAAHYFSQKLGPYQPSSIQSVPRFVIPVAVHVIHAPTHSTPGVGTNISNAQIANQMQVLNDAFAPWGIQFCLVSTDRFSDTTLDHRSSQQRQINALTSVVYKNPDEYLNIYIVKHILDDNGSPSMLAGYANGFPGMYLKDAIVVRYNYFGDLNTCGSCNLAANAGGKVMVHEAGHYLGLWHTFEGGCNAGGTDSLSCAYQGDRCCDTPPHNQPTPGTACDSSRNSCHENYAGDRKDPETNYMNYREDDCRTRFTPDQYSIMLSTLYGPRHNLINPRHINTLNLSCNFRSAYFVADRFFLCESDTVHFTAYQIGGALYKWQVQSDSSNYSSSFSSSAQLAYYLPKRGRYTVTLSLVLGADTLLFTDSNLVELAHCGGPLPSTQGNWYFGEYCGLNFRSLQPTFDQGAYDNRLPVNINTAEGTISQSNAQGRLLFYGGGEPINGGPFGGIFRLYRKNYKEMPNSPVLGDYSSMQAGIVVPFPGNGSRYYLICNSNEDTDSSIAPFASPLTDRRGLRYSIIDTVLDDVDVNYKNIPVRIPISGHLYSKYDSALVCGEMMTATPKCNGKDYWVLVSGGGFTSGYRFDRLLVLSLDSSGLHYHSHLDSVYTHPSQTWSMIKFSPDGLHIAGCNFVADFDRASGSISRLRRKSLTEMGGISFSPNSAFIYQSEGDKLYQFSTLSSDLNASKVLVYQYPYSPNYYAFNYQLGPDKKIYVNIHSKDFLGVINRPDSACTPQNPNNCGFQYNGPAVGKNGLGGVCKSGLPNMIDAKKENELPLQIKHIDSNCTTLRFYSSRCCAGSYVWDFGDNSYSTDKNPVHTYQNEGLYRVLLYAGTDTVSEWVKVGLERPVIIGDTLANCDTSLAYIYSCANNNRFCSYTWSVSNGNIIYIEPGSNTAYVKWLQNGTLYLQARHKLSGCVKIDSIHMSTMPPIVNNIDSPLLICPGTVPGLLSGNAPSGGFGAGSYAYSWYSSSDTGAVKNWNLIANATAKNYQAPALQQSTWFYRQVKSGTCLNKSNVSVIHTSINNNNIIPDTPDCDNIKGSQPISLRPFYYQWQRSSNGGTSWENIPAENGRHLQGPVFFDSTLLRRKVSDSTCVSYSNVLNLKASFQDQLQAVEDTLCPQGHLQVTGSGPCSGISSVSYRWQYSSGTGFQDIQNSYAGFKDLDKTNWNSQGWLRRKASSAGLDHYSDSIYISVTDLLNQVFVYKHSTGQLNMREAETCPGTNSPAIQGRTPCTLDQWTFQWQQSTDSSNWTDIPGKTYVDLGTVNISQTTWYRRRAVNSSSLQILMSNVLKMRVRQAEILSQPQSLTKTEGDTAVFSISYRDMQVLDWQRSRGNTAFADMGLGAVNQCKRYVESCMDQDKFRVRLQELCSGNISYSQVANLSASPLGYDLWARDSAGDNGTEPHNIRFVWNSPDIWNTRVASSSTQHENPEYRVSAPNYVHAIVRNRGTVSSLPAQLYLYWTFASTGEKWKRNWRYDTTQSQFAGNWKSYYGAKKGLGDLIGVYPVPAIAAGASWRLDTTWMPPHPGIISGDSTAKYADLCFLSRIVTCADSAFGMKQAEISDLGYNVKQNNNIVTKNFVLENIKPGNQRIHYAGNGNPSDAASIGSLVLHPQNCNFFEYAYVLLHLDEEMKKSWYDQGAQGSGFTLIDPYTIRLNSCQDLRLENIRYQAEAISWIGIEYVVRENLGLEEPLTVAALFDWQQFSQGSPEAVGGILYNVQLELEPTGSSSSQARTAGRVSGDQSGDKSLRVYPNPFGDALQLSYHLAQDGPVIIELYNLYGQLMQQPGSTSWQKAGTHHMSLNTERLPEGAYFLRFRASGYQQTQKLILLR